jgi:hypothetical protein
MSLIRPLCQVMGFTLFFVAFGGQASAVDISVPELNPGAMAGAMTLLTTGALLLTTRRRKV